MNNVRLHRKVYTPVRQQTVTGARSLSPSKLACCIVAPFITTPAPCQQLRSVFPCCSSPPCPTDYDINYFCCPLAVAHFRRRRALAHRAIPRRLGRNATRKENKQMHIYTHTHTHCNKRTRCCTHKSASTWTLRGARKCPTMIQCGTRLSYGDACSLPPCFSRAGTQMCDASASLVATLACARWVAVSLGEGTGTACTVAAWRRWSIRMGRIVWWVFCCCCFVL